MQNANTLTSITDFTRFFNSNQERFIHFAYSYLRDRAEAEDVVMESMIALWENREKWDDKSNLKAILLTIIKNKSLNILAHQQTRLRVEDDLISHRQRELDLRISTLQECNPSTIFDSEIQHIVNKALDKLPEQSRNIFILSRYQNTPNKDIAEQFGLSIKSVEFHITKVLKVLRVELKDYLISIFL